MDVREKLVELLDASPDIRMPYTPTGFVADWFIANGVTVQENTEISDELLKQLRNAPLTVLHEEPTIEVVQEWISVKEQEEPAENGTYLCHGYWLGSRRKQTETAEFFGEWDIANNFVLTHWMPLPKPPKGE